MMYTFKKDFATVAVDKKNSLIVLKWLRQPTEEEFKATFAASLETAQNYNLRRYLSINTLGINIDLSGQRWVATLGAETMQHLSLERYARVLPRDAIQEIISHKIYENLQRLLPNTMQFSVFYEEEAAMRWLLQSEKKYSKKR
ncbi:hypothetical protein [Pontibacter oryzae]|uniref:STAS/SEC14 domain-containing protein n=1 Tax=Pontibacter oryzae TaxID=2304593 RepID=A0A399SJ20_9BACT|nr:hypothetical protein [Pontibacter oryzae]RIJ41745.1 hypothetical protein D1627_06905 [Pontibacter oryzae]